MISASGSVTASVCLAVIDDGSGRELFALRAPDGIPLAPHELDFVTAIESTREYARRHC
jgi:hypothetical protein